MAVRGAPLLNSISFPFVRNNFCHSIFFSSFHVWKFLVLPLSYINSLHCFIITRQFYFVPRGDNQQHLHIVVSFSRVKSLLLFAF